MPFTVARSIEAYRPAPNDEIGVGRIPESSPHQRQYILSDDLPDTADLCTIPPRFPKRVPDAVLTQVRTIINQGLAEALPGDRIDLLSVPSMRSDLTQKARELQKKHKATIVTMDTHYVAPDEKEGIFPLQISRLYDQDTGHPLGRGPRPFYSTLEVQVDEIIEATTEKPVILTESGLSSGGTIRTIIETLKQKGVETKAICVGIGDVAAMMGLLNDYPNLEIYSLVGLHNVIDWTEIKDLLAFVPDSGQTVGRRSEEGLLVPLYNQRLIAGHTIPYPVGRIKRWTALSDEGAAIMRVAGLRASLALFKGIERANSGKRFTFDDLLKIGEITKNRVKVTLPWFLAGFGGIAREIYADNFRHYPKIAQMRIVDLLNRLLNNTYRLENGHEILLPEDVTFHRLYPGGNETILVKTFVDRPAYPEIARRLLSANPSVEQVGFIENLGDPKKPPKLHMAGGEFCGNAARALVWLLHHDEKYGSADGQYTIRVSGVKDPLRASIDKDDIVTLEMPINPSTDNIRKIDGRTYIVPMEGITHVVIYDVDYNNHTEEEADRILTQYNLKKEDAAGVIFVGQQDENLAMNPFVHVNKVGSFYNETSCASGAAAVGMVQAVREKWNHLVPKNIPIMQRSGDNLKVEVTKDGEYFRSVFVSGKVDLKDGGSFSLRNQS